MKQKFSNEYYLGSAPITKAIAHLSIPMMIGMSVGTIYNVINAFFIGLLNNTDMLTSITLGLPIFTILMAFGNMLGAGGGTFITRLIAKQDKEKAKKIAGYSFYSSIIIGILLGIIAIIALNPIVKILGADTSAIINYTKSYSLTMFIGGFAIIMNFALEQVVRAEGASKESMFGMVVSTIFGLIFDPLFILVFKFNVIGVAVSMILANIASSIYYIYYLETKSENLKGFIKNFNISLKDKIEIYKVGVSELFLAGFLIITTLLLNNYSIRYGESVVASFGIALRLVQVPEFLAMGLALGIIPLIAYNFSNENFKRLKDSIKQSALWILGLSGGFVTLVFIFRNVIIRLFSNDSAVLSVGVYIMAAMLISALFNGFTTLFTGIFQASGQGIPSTIMGITQGILFIPVIIVLNNFYGLHGVIWSMTITEIITFLTGAILYIIFNNKIKNNQVVAN
ncbi:MATE family efflux transporter [Clostridium beijerinckii]|uniref:Multidrug export protein MepA n=1 Tax=Clostridium beijerinckii TaxID=1520 RepID=A0AAE5H3G2_CLOBE|nr:MATE family efflux transporter [Clostridium beijerinckii]ALB45214.1 MATE family efflux transporter [Clostridium beijerinckii NRRL B-598]NSB13678.1 putative MATE family efflux protein [Clostridium beijerinckii]OOM29685.1 multidrug export protein MepA [Clostridium beijerinckii]